MRLRNLGGGGGGDYEVGSGWILGSGLEEVQLYVINSINVHDLTPPCAAKVHRDVGDCLG